MPIPIKYSQPNDFSLGGARLHTPSETPGSRSISATADADLSAPHPLEVWIASQGHTTVLDLTIDEAEALAECLMHVAKARRAAEAAAQAKQAA